MDTVRSASTLPKALEPSPAIPVSPAAQIKPLKEISEIERARNERGIKPLLLKAAQFETISFLPDMNAPITEISDEKLLNANYLLHQLFNFAHFV